MIDGNLTTDQAINIVLEGLPEIYYYDDGIVGDMKTTHIMSTMKRTQTSYR